MNSPRTLYGADLALQDTGALVAAEYGRLAVWEHSPLFPGLGTASIAAGRCISAGAPSRPLIFVLILAFVCHAYPAFVLYPRFHQKPLSLLVGFRFVFRFCSAFGRALTEKVKKTPHTPRMTRCEEAFFPLENQEKKASRFARLIINTISVSYTHLTLPTIYSV